MIIKYHTYKLLNNILPKVIRDTNTTYNYLKELLYPVKQKQDEFNTEIDLIKRDMMHTGQMGSLDHYINNVKYEDMGGYVYFDDEDYLEGNYVYTEGEGSYDQIYIYTNSGETGTTYDYSPTYFYTENETGLNLYTFKLIVPLIYENSDLLNGVEYYINKYKAAGTTYNIHYYSGTTTDLTYNNIGTYMIDPYTSYDSGFTGYLTGETGYLETNHNIASGMSSDTFYISDNSTNYFYGYTSNYPDNGVAKTEEFDLSISTYNFKWKIQYYEDETPVSGLTNGVDIHIYDSGDTPLFKLSDEVDSSLSGTYEYSWDCDSGSTGNYVRYFFENASDNEAFDIQLYMENENDYIPFIHKRGYEVSFDIDDIQNGYNTFNGADSLHRLFGADESGYTFNKYTGATADWLYTTDATYYSMKYTGETTGTAYYGGAADENRNGYIDVKIKINDVNDISNMQLLLVDSSVDVIDSITIPESELYEGNIYIWRGYYVSGDTSYLGEDTQFRMYWDNDEVGANFDFELGFEYDRDQRISVVLVDSGGTEISDETDLIKEEGSYTYPLSPYYSVDSGKIRFNIYNNDYNAIVGSMNGLTITNLVITENNYE
jgi:hypothetical protein